MSLRLISVRFSHYCEKARWALDRAGLAYTEDAHVPVLSWRATFGARGGRTVPVLVTPDGVLEDSTEILRWIDRQGRGPALFPAGPMGDDVAALEDEADRRVGPASRRLAYHALFTDPDATRALVLSAGPGWERHAGRAVYPLLRQVIRRGLKVDEGAPEVSLSRVRALMQEATKAGNYALALEWCETVLQRYKSHPEFLRAKASLLLMMSERDKAIEVYEQAEAIESDPAVRKKLEELQKQQP